MQVHLYDQLHVQTPSWIKSNWKNIKKDKEKMFGYYGILAAGYNGNMTRVKSEAFEKEKDLNLVDYSQIIKNVTGNNETLTYVLKFRYVWEYLTSNHPEIFVQQI